MPQSNPCLLYTYTEQAEYEIVAVFKTVAYSSEGFRYYDFVDAENEEMSKPDATFLLFPEVLNNLQKVSGKSQEFLLFQDHYPLSF